MSGNCTWLGEYWWATVKLVVTGPVAGPAVTRARTVTCSPAVNGRLGMKLSPVPVEYGRSTPVCLPLREPVTATEEIVVPLPPRKLICVAGDASGVPGCGETATGFVAAARAIATVPGTSTLAEEVPPHAISATAQPVSVSAGEITRSRRIGPAGYRARRSLPPVPPFCGNSYFRPVAMWHASRLGPRATRCLAGNPADMRRYVLTILGVAVLAWGVLALVLGSASLKLGAGSAGASPACLPASAGASAALSGTAVDVSPAPGSVTANPHTQISFLGASASSITAVAVRGTHSGAHAGALRPYSQGDGASFVPSTAFDAGEQVTVTATVSGRPVSFSFQVDTPYPTAATPDFHNPKAAPADYQSFYTEPGVQAPVLTVTTPDRDPAAGDVFTTNGPGPGAYGPLIYSPQGKLVWFDDLPGAQTAEDLALQSYEGAQALTWWEGRVLEYGFGQGEDVVMNDRYQVIARVHGGNGLPADLHDFQLQPHGIAYITAFNPIRCNTTSVGGVKDGTVTDTAIQEIDMKTGLVRWEWHSLDHVGAGESEVEASKSQTPWDYFHINSIDPEPNGDLLISARSTWAMYQLQAGSGRVLWRLGGKKSSFKMGPGTQTAWQHDARMQPDGEITVFDDGSNPPIHKQSRGLRIALDEARHEARLVASYEHPDPPLLAASQGSMQTLEDGNSVIGYGGVPEITEYSPGGAVLFDAHLPYDMSFFRAYRHPWSALPATPPAAFSSQDDTGEETIVYASWNGATGVTSWRAARRLERRLAGEQGDDRLDRVRERGDPARELPIRRGPGTVGERPRARHLAARQDDRLLRLAPAHGNGQVSDSAPV